MAKRTAGLRYVGGGRWIAGVPARDLSAEEVERWPEAAESPLYEPVRAQPQGTPSQGSGLPESED